MRGHKKCAVLIQLLFNLELQWPVIILRQASLIVDSKIMIIEPRPTLSNVRGPS